MDTPNGCASIESLELGDEVVTRDQYDPSSTPETGPVTRLYRRVAPAILWLTFAGGTVLGTTPGHEVWTEQSGWGFAADLCPGDTMIDGDGFSRVVVLTELDPRPTLVYNLEVAGTNTYFVHGLWVHNCSAGRGKGSKFAPNKLDRHFEDHGRDFGAASAKNYEQMADDFLTGPSNAGLLEKTRSNGDVVRYNPLTEEFGVVSKDGVVRTYFKPDPGRHGYPTNLDYFNAQ